MFDGLSSPATSSGAAPPPPVPVVCAACAEPRLLQPDAIVIALVLLGAARPVPIGQCPGCGSHEILVPA